MLDSVTLLLLLILIGIIILIVMNVYLFYSFAQLQNQVGPVIKEISDLINKLKNAPAPIGTFFNT